MPKVRPDSPDGFQWCCRCSNHKPCCDFHKDVDGPNGLGYMCKKCQSEKASQRRKNRDPEAQRQLDRYNHIRRYGLTPEKYHEFYENQNGECPICLNYFEKLVIDHNHTTGKFRGLICSSCNLMLGHSRDIVNTLLNAADYLRRTTNG
jgi:hypothetical protein